MATCVDLANAEYPKEVKGQKIVPLQGVSLKPTFSGKELGRKKPIYWEHEGNRAIRIGKWKLVAKGANGAWELYDLDADRSELNNLASIHEDRAKEMADKWEEWAIEAKAKPWPWPWLCLGLYGPFFPFVCHLFRTVLVYGCQVVQLRAVCIQVIKFPCSVGSFGHQFPFSNPDCPISFVLPINWLLTS